MYVYDIYIYILYIHIYIYGPNELPIPFKALLEVNVMLQPYYSYGATVQVSLFRPLLSLTVDL